MNKLYRSALVLYIVTLVILLGSYVWNAVELTQCDFEAPYRCEIVHGIGVVVPAVAPISLAIGSDRP